MIKFRISKDEWYPVYTVDTYEKSINPFAEMSQEDYDAWQKAEEQFQLWQDRVRDLLRDAREKRK